MKKSKEMHSRRNRIILLLNRYVLQINSKVNCERRKILYCGSVVGLTAASYLGAYKWLSRNKPIPILLHAAQSENLLDNFRLSIENSRAIIDKAKVSFQSFVAYILIKTCRLKMRYQVLFAQYL